jgi:hypothetical protein
MGWTRDHRGQILGAPYTILIGNPRRSGPQETRFKDWMALVGTAVEYAAELADERPADDRTTPMVSFKAAFERTEASDDASANVPVSWRRSMDCSLTRRNSTPEE